MLPTKYTSTCSIFHKDVLLHIVTFSCYYKLLLILRTVDFLHIHHHVSMLSGICTQCYSLLISVLHSLVLKYLTYKESSEKPP